MVTNQSLKRKKWHTSADRQAARDSRKNWLRKRGLSRDPDTLESGFVRGAKVQNPPKRYRTISQGKDEPDWQHERPVKRD